MAKAVAVEIEQRASPRHQLWVVKVSAGLVRDVVIKHQHSSHAALSHAGGSDSELCGNLILDPQAHGRVQGGCIDAASVGDGGTWTIWEVFS